jgi:CHAD domain-containing protein
MTAVAETKRSVTAVAGRPIDRHDQPGSRSVARQDSLEKSPLRARRRAVTVATAVLEEQLAKVWHLVADAGDPLADPEVVHQLRVSTRRALAAFALFKPLLPRKQRRRWVGWLRAIRRSAGAARDLDVLTDRIRHHLPPTAEAARPLQNLLDLLSDHQVASRIPLRQHHAHLLSKHWTRRVDRLLATLSKNKRRTRFGPFIHRRLARAGHWFCKRVDQPSQTVADLHQLRIAGKQVRYSLELFPYQDEPRLLQCQRSLKRLQDALGDVTDHAAAADRFHRLCEEPLPTDLLALTSCLQREEADLAQLASKRFNDWWTPKRRRRLRRRFFKVLTP